MPNQEKKLNTQSLPTKEGFSLVSKFRGYRNKEDITNLKEGYLVRGSKNVLVNTSGRLEARRGYTLYGQADTTLAPILSSFDWDTHFGQARNLRAGNDKLQFSYKASAGDYYKGVALTADQIVWVDLLTSTASNNFNFSDFWDTTNLLSKLLFVNGQSEINEWTGGVANFASATANTITKQGSTSWAEEGFYPTGTHTVIINGTSYQATGGWATTTLTGVTPDPTAAGHDVGEIVFQKVETTLNSAMTDLPSIENDLISVLTNQVYVASFKNRSVYVSKINTYVDFGFSATRLVGEGAILTLDGNPVALIPQERNMYISAGKNQWYSTEFTLSSDNTAESLSIEKLKTGIQQATQSQAMACNTKNNVMFISNEPTLDELGRIVNRDVVPQSENISDSIKLDFDSYDFTDGSVFYYKYNIYIAVPKENLFRIYNIKEGYWEAPQEIAISRFSIIDGELYGHSYLTPETYKLFEGYNDNGNSYECEAIMSYQNYGMRANTKIFIQYYLEGYIDTNTLLKSGIKYEIDGCATDKEVEVKGTDSIVCISETSSSLGKSSLGKNPLGGEAELVSSTDLPPKFRVIKTTTELDFYEVQYSFSSVGIDQRWEILAFGGLVNKSSYNNNKIKQ